MSNYENRNGLEDGRIPAGKPCPWIATCALREARCPRINHLHIAAYGCACARFHSLMMEASNDVCTTD